MRKEHSRRRRNVLDYLVGSKNSWRLFSPEPGEMGPAIELAYIKSDKLVRDLGLNGVTVSRPISKAYRGISYWDWDLAVNIGYLADFEKIGACLSKRCAIEQIPVMESTGDRFGLVLVLDVTEEDEWYTTAYDTLLRTNEAVNLDKVSCVIDVPHVIC